MKRFFLTLLVILPASVYASDWQHTIEPYALGASIEGDASIGRAVGVPVDIDTSRIMETLNMAAMIHYEAVHESGWGFMFDYGFMDLRDDISGARGGVLDAKLRQGIMEAMVMKRSPAGDDVFDYYGGVRWWDNDIDVEVDPALLPGTREAEIDEDWVDVVLGVRWTRRVSQNWQLTANVDMGGLGLESDFTASTSLGAIYTINDRLELDMRYRGLWVDYESGDPGDADYFEYDTVTHGPLIGLKINL